MDKTSLPYRYLDITLDPLIFDWKKFIDDPESVFHIKDHGGNLLRPEIKDFFCNLGLRPKRGNLWSRKPKSIPPYHTDQKVDCERFAVNWLLSGSPGITEWSWKALEYKIDNDKLSPIYDDTSPQFWGSLSLNPDVSAVLDKPMIIQTDIPHRVINRNDTWRISYSLRFEDNPTWETGLEKLKEYILD